MSNVIINPYVFGIVQTFGVVDNAGVTTNAGSLKNNTYRNIINAATMTAPSGTPTVMAVQIKASSSENLVVPKMYIQHQGAGDVYDFSATPVQVTWDSGNASTGTITANNTKESDFVAFAWDKSSNIVISMWIDNAEPDGGQTVTPGTDYQIYNKSGDDAATVDATGYSLWFANSTFIDQLRSDGF